MVAVNILIYSSMLAKMHNLKHVVWIGVHIDILEYMQMSEVYILDFDFLFSMDSIYLQRENQI